MYGRCIGHETCGSTRRKSWNFQEATYEFLISFNIYTLYFFFLYKSCIIWVIIKYSENSQNSSFDVGIKYQTHCSPMATTSANFSIPWDLSTLALAESLISEEDQILYVVECLGLKYQCQSLLELSHTNYLM